jgi:heat-inducible transcriptional repressor
MDLTNRQIAIIKAIVEEYTKTAEAVGSVTLEQKYRLGVSPATLRNEMAHLTDKGYLAKSHASAGRIPTPLAIKLYVNELMQEKNLSVAEEVAVREKVWESRSELNVLLKEATKILSERTKSLSVAVLDQDHVYHHGYANLLDFQEFFNLDITRQVLIILDQHTRLSEIFDRGLGNEPIHLLIGDELGYDTLKPVSCLYADIQVGDKRGSLGIIGPYRQIYERNIPVLRYIANLVNQVAQDW